MKRLNDLINWFRTRWLYCWALGWPRLKEEFWRAIAWRLPHTLVMWATIRLMAHATQGAYSHQIVPDLKAMEALDRWRAK